MEWYNFETMFASLKDILLKYLYNNNISFELSKDNEYYHFEILTDAAGAAAINYLLDNNETSAEAK